MRRIVQMFTSSVSWFLEKNLKLLTVGAIATIVLAGSFYSQGPQMAPGDVVRCGDRAAVRIPGVPRFL